MTRPARLSYTRPRSKAKRCWKCGKMTPLDKLYCQRNANDLFLVTEPAVCVECLQVIEAAQRVAAAEDTETS